MLAAGGDDLFGYGDPLGLPALRHELRAYLARARGIDADPDRIAIVPGVSAGLAELARLLHDNGLNTLAVEEPGFPFQHDVLRRNGLQVTPVPVDAEGIDVAVLARGTARAVLVTPAHQYPSGVVMSATRRTQLATWATHSNSWIIEDDYDSEFRYDRQPLGALAGLVPDRVIYAGTTSKTLGGGLRLAWLVLPAELIGPFIERRGRDCAVAQFLQATLATFIADGQLDRHVRTMRTRYRRRRDELLDTLQTLPAELEISGVAAGLHLTATFPATLTERDVLRAAAEHNL
ncbi:MAG: PLP-dependent aminotransferase family protein, partial [Acidimicrobiia bacterium]